MGGLFDQRHMGLVKGSVIRIFKINVKLKILLNLMLTKICET